MQAQIGKDERTGRACVVVLQADSFADERLLTAIMTVLATEGRITAKPRRGQSMRWEVVRQHE